MARPRTFDREDVLDKALETFWKQGYAATSVQDLVDATGVNRASLYNTFGGKHELFVEVLERYQVRWIDFIVETLQQTSSAADGVRNVFERAIKRPGPISDACGCLMTNTATELANRDEVCAEKVRSAFQRIEQAFKDTLERGQQQGEISPAKDTRALARFLTSNLQGLRVMAQADPNASALQDIVDVSLQVLD